MHGRAIRTAPMRSRSVAPRSSIPPGRTTRRACTTAWTYAVSNLGVAAGDAPSCVNFAGNCVSTTSRSVSADERQLHHHVHEPGSRHQLVLHQSGRDRIRLDALFAVRRPDSADVAVPVRSRHDADAERPVAGAPGPQPGMGRRAADPARRPRLQRDEHHGKLDDQRGHEFRYAGIHRHRLGRQRVPIRQQGHRRRDRQRGDDRRRHLDVGPDHRQHGARVRPVRCRARAAPSTPARSRSPRRSAARRSTGAYNCSSSNACPYSTPPYINNLVTADGGTGTPTGYTKWSTVYSCSPGSLVVPSGNWYIDCAGGVSDQRHPHLPRRQHRQRQRHQRHRQRHAARQLRRRQLDRPCPSNPASASTVYIRSGGLSKAGNVSFIMHETFVYFASGTVNLAGNATLGLDRARGSVRSTTSSCGRTATRPSR